MRKLFILLSYLGAFILGSFAVIEFKFNHPIEGQRWVIASLVFVISLILSNDTKED